MEQHIEIEWVSAVLAAVLLIGCGGSQTDESDGCTEGRAIECMCPSGEMGAQTCREDGTWAACECRSGAMTDTFGEPDTGERTDAGPDTGHDESGRDTGTSMSDTGESDSGGRLDWKTPYPSAPDDADYVEPGDMPEAIQGLEPGDTIVLRDGTYDGMRFADVDGTEEAPITVMAENERQPVVEGNGYDAALRIVESSYLKIKGIRFRNVNVDEDNSEIFGAMPIYVSRSDHITLWRNVARHPNLYGNNTAIKLNNGTHHSLVEENEVLDFHRNGISIYNNEDETATRKNVVRRNYVNPRDTHWKGRRWGPNYAIACYRGAETIVENNIVDYSQESGEDSRMVQNPGPGNEFYGNIIINPKYGFGHWYYDTDMADVVMENNLVLDPKSHGTFAHSVPGFVAHNNTIVRPGSHGFKIDDPDTRDPDFEGINNLVIGADDYGYTVPDADTFTDILFSYSGGWDNGDGTWGAGTESRSNVLPSSDPQFGDTYVHVPEGSPYAGSGKDGADVGANILYRYEDGEMTGEPLWNPETGEFPHGAVVDGVNDEEGHSAFDVHERLRVRPATLPDDY